MEQKLQLTITLKMIRLPRGTGDEPWIIARALKVPVDNIIDVTLFREQEGFVAVTKATNRRLNFAKLFKELGCSWSAFPSPGDLRKFGAVNIRNPFALAAKPGVRMVVDAWTLQRRPKLLIIPLGNDRVLRTTVTDLMVGTAAKVLGEKSI